MMYGRSTRDANLTYDILSGFRSGLVWFIPAGAGSAIWNRLEPWSRAEVQYLEYNRVPTALCPLCISRVPNYLHPKLTGNSAFVSKGNGRSKQSSCKVPYSMYYIHTRTYQLIGKAGEILRCATLPRHKSKMTFL